MEPGGDSRDLRYFARSRSLDLRVSSLACVYSKPGSPFRLAWDALSMFVLLYDVIMMPMKVFETSGEEAQVLEVALWVTQVFWSLDLVASFFVGYYARG
eukprot:CAMPEP_0168461682 /NCGR_PEP_ID=MMETSP0228-20121227/54112_1 /TAXON_ID=133427 /ORGANISM="Protoceratium reticulatum, Strain CCCM 535 (=CCMP 1889)" /LENGTH=98 /DNA_ID=CAMNT_0008477007 /DNA_START=1 /DNA_END=293 /DNA_ORIENTATION=+